MSNYVHYQQRDSKIDRGTGRRTNDIMLYTISFALLVAFAKQTDIQRSETTYLSMVYTAALVVTTDTSHVSMTSIR